MKVRKISKLMFDKLIKGPKWEKITQFVYWSQTTGQIAETIPKDKHDEYILKTPDTVYY